MRPPTIADRGGAWRRVALAFAVLLAATTTATTEGESAALLLQNAYHREMTLNDPAGALALYDRALAAPGLRAEQAATARVRRGICLRRLGRIADAESEFQTVIDRFPAEKEAVRLAQRLLGVGSPRHPARFLSPKTFAYFELVDPGDQVGFISSLVRGTPLENPVDYYLAAAARESETASKLPRPRDRELARLRAFLNLGFIKELQKIEGFALGVVSPAPGETETVGVFLPGASDVSRGLIKAIMTLAGQHVAESVGGMPIFALRDGPDAPPDAPPDAAAAAERPPFYIAMDSAEEVVIFGTSLEEMRAAIRRFRSEDSPPPSLAELPDFRRALAARAGSIAFTYFRAGELLDLVLAKEPTDGRRDIETLARALGLRDMESSSLTLSRNGDALHLALRSRIGGEHAAWDILRTPVLDLAVLDLLPDRTLGFAALSLPDPAARLRRALALAGEPGSDAAPELPPPLARLLESGAAGDAADAMLAGVESIAIVAPAGTGLSPGLAHVFMIGFRAGAVTPESFEQALGRTLAGIVDTRAAREFRDAAEPIELGGVAVTPRVAEPLPGWRVAWARRGDIYLVAPTLEALRTAYPGGNAPPVAAADRRDGIPATASKVIDLRPLEFFREHPALAPRGRSPGAILARVPRVILHTLESSGAVSIELVVPDAAPLLRRELMELPTLDEGGAPEEEEAR